MQKVKANILKYLPARINQFYLKHQRVIDIQAEDLFYHFKVFFKAYLVIKFIKWIDYPGPIFIGNTPVWLDKRVLKHPLLPPFWLPHPTDPKEAKDKEKYDELMEKIQYDTLLDSVKFRYLNNEHPMRETSTTIDEYLYDNDNDRIFTEMKHSSNLDMIRKKIVKDTSMLNKEGTSDDREATRKALNAKIKPC